MNFRNIGFHEATVWVLVAGGVGSGGVSLVVRGVRCGLSVECRCVLWRYAWISDQWCTWIETPGGPPQAAYVRKLSP